MNFVPRTEEEIGMINLLEKGVYPFEVVSATDEISKSGNEMIKLNLKIWDKAGKTHTMFDYLLEAMSFKLRHFAEHTGLIEKYNAGRLNAGDCIKRCGNVQIDVEKPRVLPDGREFPAKNTVKDYCGKEKVPTLAPRTDAFINDDVPF